MKCHPHEAEAVGVCASCGRPLCDQCLHGHDLHVYPLACGEKCAARLQSIDTYLREAAVHHQTFEKHFRSMAWITFAVAAVLIAAGLVVSLTVANRYGVLLGLYFGVIGLVCVWGGRRYLRLSRSHQLLRPDV